jgi:hypothetical protein
VRVNFPFLRRSRASDGQTQPHLSLGLARSLDRSAGRR